MAVLLKFLHQVPSLLVILWLLSSSCSAKETGEGQQYPPSSHIVSISSLLPSTVCNSSSKVSNIGSLELVHKYGPCSELNKQGETTSTPSLSEILHEDQARVDSINSRRRRSMMKSDTNQELIRKTKLPFSYDVSIGTGNFYVKVDIGTPRQSVYVVLDTGSDITWIQCKPCSVKCFKQVGPIFNPSKSSSYSTFPCDSSRCNMLSASKRRMWTIDYGEVLISAYTMNQSPPHEQLCKLEECAYSSLYGDGSYTNGLFVEDKLTFTSANHKSKEIDYLFGCGHNNSAVGSIGVGIMGLSRALTSFVYQTDTLFKKYFSYCLPSDYSSTGYIIFGKTNNNHIKFTPIPTTPQQSQFYDVVITGISVAGKKLPIKSSVFGKRGGGAIVDSGTVITWLQPEAYAALRSTFRKEMSHYHYKMAAPVKFLDTCYDLSSHKTVEIPKVSFFFKGGVELELDVKGTIIPVTDSGHVVCFAFAPNVGNAAGAILGNIMQRTVQVVYDVEGRRVGFGPAACT